MVPQYTDDAEFNTYRDDVQPVESVTEEHIEEVEDAPTHDVQEEQNDTVHDGGDHVDTTIVQQDNTGQDLEEDDDNEPEVPRRSTRQRTSTANTRYRDFVCKRTQPTTDWMTRAQFLKDAVACGLFRGSEEKVADALLKLAIDSP